MEVAWRGVARVLTGGEAGGAGKGGADGSVAGRWSAVGSAPALAQVAAGGAGGADEGARVIAREEVADLGRVGKSNSRPNHLWRPLVGQFRYPI